MLEFGEELILSAGSAVTVVDLTNDRALSISAELLPQPWNQLGVKPCK